MYFSLYNIITLFSFFMYLHDPFLYPFCNLSLHLFIGVFPCMFLDHLSPKMPATDTRHLNVGMHLLTSASFLSSFFVLSCLYLQHNSFFIINMYQFWPTSEALCMLYLFLPFLSNLNMSIAYHY